MPGLFGIFAKAPSLSKSQLSKKALRMADVMRTRPWHFVEMGSEHGFCGGRVHLGVLNPLPQPLALKEQSKSIQIWFDGEIYPEALSEAVTPSAEQVFGWLQNKALLAQVDGVFACVCFDPVNQQLTLIADRLGFRPLYYAETPDWFAYASEVKALLAICDRVPDVDHTGLRQFFGFGHMLGNRTWWKDINLFPPANVWQVSSIQDPKKHVYWTFDAIKHEPRAEEEVLEEFARLWSRSVRQRSKSEVMPLLLSGGLDSRLLLAELTEQKASVVTITFGDAHSTDIQLARQCAAIANAPHRELLITNENWWHRREEAIWYTDGLINSRDLHSAMAMDDMYLGARYSPMNIAGDLLFGGSYLNDGISTKWKSYPEQLMLRKYLANPFFSRDEVLAASHDDINLYTEGPSTDCYYLLQRVRRATLNGPICTMPYCEASYPSVSYFLLQLVLGCLGDEYRLDGKFYNRYLLSYHPQFYRDVPWQKTGRGLKETLPVRLVRGGKGRIKRAFTRVLRQTPKPYYGFFVNYPELVRNSGALANFFPKSLLADELLQGAGGQCLKNFSASEPETFALIGLLTLEIYLRQVTGMGSLSGLKLDVKG